MRMQKTYRHEMAKRRLAEKRQLGNGGATIAADGITIVRDFGAAESNSMCAQPCSDHSTDEAAASSKRTALRASPRPRRTSRHFAKRKLRVGWARRCWIAERR